MRADVRGNGSYDVTTTGAADAGRAAARPDDAARRASGARTKARAHARAGRRARRAPRAPRRAPSRASRTCRSRATTRSTPTRSSRRLPELSQVDLGTVEAYERRKQNRTTVLERITVLRASEPWAGYDELRRRRAPAAAVRRRRGAARAVREYERAHKNRAGVIEATERELANA